MSTVTPVRRARKFGAALALLTSAALVLTGCSSSDSTENDSNDSSASASEGFPVTVSSAYGDVTLPEKPERIVVLSAQYADILASINVEAVAYNASTATEEQAFETYPWLAGEAIGEFDPDMVNAEYQAVLEAVAKHEPDLILTSTFQVDEELYEQLSVVAPTFVGAEIGSNTWSSLLADIGTLTGETEAAAAAEAEVDAAYAVAREAMPGLEGKTYQSVGFDGTKFWFGNGSWLDGFGLVPAENQDNSQSGNGTNDISLENVAELDADVLSIWYYQVDAAGLEADPRYAKLPAVENGAIIVPDLPLANATNSAGPLSLIWAIDWVSAQLADSTIAQ